MGAVTPSLSDASADVDARVVASWRAMSPCEKWDQVMALNDACERLSEAGVRARYPSASADEIRFRVLALRLGRRFMIEVYGWDPEIEGW